MTLKFQEGAKFGDFKGSTFRGAFGHALKYVSCNNFQENNCTICEKRTDCTYFNIFENETSMAQWGQNNIHPYIIRADGEDKKIYKTNDLFDFSIILIGEKAINQIKVVIKAFQAAGLKGVGANLSPFYIKNIISKKINILDILNTTIPTDKLNIEFMTPLELKDKNIFQKKPTFEAIYNSMNRRFNTLDHLFGDRKINFQNETLQNYASTIEMSSQQIKTISLQRRSNRQEKLHPIYGIMGNINFSGDLMAFYPLLKLAELLHIGKKTVMGMGQIKVNLI